MANQWWRRACLLAACASALAVAACGGGGVASQLVPARIIAFGDAFADVGQNGAQYTVNDTTTVKNWTEYIATAYGKTITPVSKGGLSYATGNARVTATPDAAGNSTTPTVAAQISSFLAVPNTFAGNDLVILNAGMSDVIVQAQAAFNGTQTRDAALAGIAQAGKDMGAQVRRVVNAGAKYVLVVGSYNLGRSPWALKATDTTRPAFLENASRTFNDALLVSIVDLGTNVLYVDSALLFNLAIASPSSYDVTNVTDVVCTSVDSGPGIGIGAGQVNSNLCTGSTLVTGADPLRYLFADPVYVTPKGHQRFGDYAYNLLRGRF
jgi:outer membrane lipase/esterase